MPRSRGGAGHKVSARALEACVTEEVIETILMTAWVAGFPTLVASRSMLEKLLS
jgi:alkylhydroperoxidase/carboxymuconolactone decarboxylase family protein YurZ